MEPTSELQLFEWDIQQPKESKQMVGRCSIDALEAGLAGLQSFDTFRNSLVAPFCPSALWVSQ